MGGEWSVLPLGTTGSARVSSQLRKQKGDAYSVPLLFMGPTYSGPNEMQVDKQLG